jgi:hypothetical protein
MHVENRKGELERSISMPLVRKIACGTRALGILTILHYIHAGAKKPEIDGGNDLSGLPVCMSQKRHDRTNSSSESKVVVCALPPSSDTSIESLQICRLSFQLRKLKYDGVTVSFCAQHPGHHFELPHTSFLISSSFSDPNLFFLRISGETKDITLVLGSAA